MATIDMHMSSKNVERCGWGSAPGLMSQYHDNEWGFPTADDTHLFEKICLEGFQSGLSWSTILNKREDFRRVFWMFGYEGTFAPVQFVLTSYYCCCPVEGLLVLIFDMSS